MILIKRIELTGIRAGSRWCGGKSQVGSGTNGAKRQFADRILPVKTANQKEHYIVIFPFFVGFYV